MTWQAVTEEKVRLTFSPTYNLFRRKLTPDLGCAVPEDRPVPAFLDGSTWEYAGTLRQDDVLPRGFEPTAAECGTRLNGFHLFQIIGAVAAGAPIEIRRFGAPAHASAGWLHGRIDQSHRPAGQLRSHSASARCLEPLKDHWQTGGEAVVVPAP
ncbi:hypothetical protein [Microvirga yunnanensis]|uniref:hypothetical protein n=1 Tax=Microvirga yunnanensis TaxID=2953740 RepID=UPI0021C998B6|nr:MULTISPECIES: hypothetical protein [unclassified Microvirga]